ncbi:MAG: hypothetical protein BGO65_09030 [Afipia sp. 64-13]|nr:MAG: hypothetical protein BGO65_09030 [Afipia sp. 64-13]
MPTIGFPLLLIPLAIYNIFVFLMPDVAFTAPLLSVHLMSGADWAITFGDALLALGLLLLWFEIARAARPGAKYFTDHVLSLVVFAVAAAEFVLLAPFATSTFFLLTVLTAVEFLAGTSIALRHRRYFRQVAASASQDEAPVKTKGSVPVLDRPIADEPVGAFWGPEPLQRDPEIDPPPPAPPSTPAPATGPAPVAPTPPSAAPAPSPVTPLPLTSPSAPAEPAPEVPALEKISPAEHPAPRSVADWSAADLVADNDAHDNTPRPDTPAGGKPPETPSR